jgi:hypothetical protein
VAEHGTAPSRRDARVRAGGPRPFARGEERFARMPPPACPPTSADAEGWPADRSGLEAVVQTCSDRQSPPRLATASRVGGPSGGAAPWIPC